MTNFNCIFLRTNQLICIGWDTSSKNSSTVSDIFSPLFDNALLIWDSGRGRWHTEPSSSVLRPETRAWARLCPASGSGSGLSGRLWLRLRLCCILASSSLWHSASVSLGPASLLSVSLSLSPRGPPMMPGPGNVTAPRPAPPGPVIAHHA